EVVEYAAEGVAATASQGTTAYLEACAAAIALQARLISRRLAEERSKPFGEHADVGEIRREVAPAVRTAIMVGGLDAAEELVGLNLDEWPWTRAADIILRILGQAPDSALAVDFHHRIASGIVQQYDRRVEERGTGYGVD